jgi:hypothetical protein
MSRNSAYAVGSIIATEQIRRALALMASDVI